MPSLNCVVIVNGCRHEIVAGSVPHYLTAFDYLRNHLQLKSLKFASLHQCSGGVNVGGALIMVSSLNAMTGALDPHRLIDATTCPIVSLHGCAITTLEAIGSSTAPHPIQQRLAEMAASLCGYCAPGLSVALYTLLMNSYTPTVKDVDRAISGMWCRCTGFRAALDVAHSFASDIDEALRVRYSSLTGDGDDVDSFPPLSDQADYREVKTTVTELAALRKKFPLYPHEHLKPPVVPVEPPLFLFYGTNDTAFLLPGSVDEVIRSCKVVPDYTTINGAQDFENSVLSKITTPDGPPMAILSTSRVKEMLDVSFLTDAATGQLSLFIGAAATYSYVIQKLPKLMAGAELATKDPWTLAALLELRGALENLTVCQAEENSHTLVSHMLSRPCGDLVPFLHALKATLVVLTAKGREEFSAVDVTGASRSLARLDVILGIRIPPQKNRFVGFEKTTLSVPRAPATCSVAMSCDILRRDIDIVANNFCVACAGASFYMTVLPDVAAALDRINLTSDTMKQLRAALDRLLMSLRNLVHGPSDGRVAYRITVTRSLIFRMFCRLQNAVGGAPLDRSALPAEMQESVPVNHHKRGTMGVQSWEVSFGGLYDSQREAVGEVEEVVIPPSAAALEAAAAEAAALAEAKKKLLPKSIRSDSSTSGGTPAAAVNTISPRTPLLGAEMANSRKASSTSRLVVKRPPVGDAIPPTHSVSDHCGTTVFTQDINEPKGCLFAAMVRSTIVKGTAKCINADAVMALPGVVGYFDFSNLPKKIVTPSPDSPESVAGLTEGWTGGDLTVFLDKDVDFIGQPIGIVVATSSILAHRAAAQVNIEYVRDHRVAYALSVQEARETKSFFPVTDNEVLSVASSPAGAAGSRAAPLRKAFDNKDFQLFSGSFSIGGQFPLSGEPVSVLAIPDEDEMEVFATTECPARLQLLIASVLHIPMANVVVKTKRVAGPKGFSHIASCSAAVAFAAHKLQKPVSFVSSLEEDMRIGGTSHSAVVEWRVAIDPVTTLIQALDCQLFLNCGSRRGESDEVLRSALRHMSNAYNIPLLRARGTLCKTNFPPAAVMCGMGAPIAVVAVENILDAVARNIKVPRWKLQQSHLLQPMEPLPYGQLASGCRMPTLWQDLVISSNVSDRMLGVDDFNKKMRYRKRGIAMCPVFYGCRMPVDEDAHGKAVVTLNADGTVRISHGVVDCGYGVDTKLVQVVSRALRIPMKRITVSKTATDVIPEPNHSAHRMAVEAAGISCLNACEQLLARLGSILAECNGSLSAAAKIARNRQISLSVEGRTALFDSLLQSPRRENGSASASCGKLCKRPSLAEPHAYFVSAVACTEVELDVLTGTYCIVRMDALIDCGQSINPLIDTLLVESKMLQGSSWLTTEEIVAGDAIHPDVPEGTYFNASLREYHCPRIDRPPQDIRVTFSGNSSNYMLNTGGVHSSKSVMETALMTGATTMFALREAVYAAREHWGEVRPPYLEMHAPLTAERLRMACTDEFSQGAHAGAECPVPGSY